MKCYKCGAIIQKGSIFCCKCGERVTVDLSGKHWLMAVAEDESNWIQDTDKWPSIIAYEYYRLRELCRKKQAYGVLINLKDNFEAVLKFEVLLGFAWADNNNSLEDNIRQKVVSLITTPNLTMGAWLELGQTLISSFGNILPDEIPLKILRDLYNKSGIVGWRNKRIGHGAMELEDDVAFQNDIKDKILILKSIHEKLAQYYLNQRLFIDDDSDTAGMRTYLQGAQMARGLEREGLVSCSINDATTIAVDPYIIIRKHETRGMGVYFFDNQKTKTLSSFLAYSEGSNKNESIAYFENLRSYLDKGQIELTIESDDQDVEEAEERELEVLQMSHSFVKPEYLLRWIRTVMEENGSGIFLLKMNRGMGKSVFTDMLNRLNSKIANSISKDLDVRTYHYSRTQLVHEDDVRRRIELLWARQYDGGFWERCPRISDIESGGKTPSEAFARFLEIVREHSRRKRDKDSVLMILDGLDEISHDELWNMIPDKSMLGEGVYILLTSRDPSKEELPADIINHLNGIHPTTELTVSYESEDNKKFLREYIQRTGIDLEPNNMERIIRYSDYCVLYLGVLCKLMESGLTIEDLPKAKMIITTYLDALGNRYGEKESIRIREILAILSTLGEMERLSISEIAGFSTFGRVTLEFIGMLRDLAPLLKIERSEDGNKYRIANPGLAAEIAERITEKKEVILELIKLGTDQIREGFPVEYVKSEIIISHIVDLAMQISAEKDDCFDILGSSFKNDYCRFIKAVRETDMKSPGAERLPLYLMQGLKYFKMLDRKQGNYDSEYDTIYKYALYLRDHNMHNQALQVFDELIGLFDGINVELRRMGNIRFFQACLLYKINKVTEAENLHKEAIDIWLSCVQNNNTTDVNNLARSYNTLAFFYYRMMRFDDADKYYLKALELCESKRDGDEESRKIYAQILNNAALLKLKLGDPDTAGDYHVRAMSIREELAKNGSGSALGWLAQSYLNYARYLFDQKGDSKTAKEYFEKANNIYKKRSETDYAISSYYYGKMLSSIDPQMALSVQQEVYRIRRKLAATNYEAMSSDLSDSLFEIGKLKETLGEVKEAKKYIKEAYEIKADLYDVAPDRYRDSFEKTRLVYDRLNGINRQ